MTELSYEQLPAGGTRPLCAALSGLCATLTLNPGLTPWAILLDPFGVPSFAPETSKAETRSCATSSQKSWMAFFGEAISRTEAFSVPSSSRRLSGLKLSPAHAWKPEAFGILAR